MAAPARPFGPEESVAVDLLESLVRIPSPSRHEAAAVRFLVDRMNSLGLRAFIDVAGNAIGAREGAARPVHRLKTGTSDWNVVVRTWNCPSASSGPGDSALDHTPDEHILAPDFLRSIDILCAALGSLARELCCS